MPLSGLLERDVGVSPEGHGLLLTLETVVPAPQPASRRDYIQVQTAPVRKGMGPVSDSCILSFRRRKLHTNKSSPRSHHPYHPLTRNAIVSDGTPRNKKHRKTPAIT